MDYIEDSTGRWRKAMVARKAPRELLRVDRTSGVPTLRKTGYAGAVPMREPSKRV